MHVPSENSYDLISNNYLAHFSDIQIAKIFKNKFDLMS